MALGPPGFALAARATAPKCGAAMPAAAIATGVIPVAPTQAEVAAQKVPTPATGMDGGRKAQQRAHGEGEETDFHEKHPLFRGEDSGEGFRMGRGPQNHRVVLLQT